MTEKHLPDKKRLLWQCRRGMLELEILLKEFLTDDYDKQSEKNKLLFESLLTVSDPLLLAYLLGHSEPADKELKTIVDVIRQAARHRVATHH